MQFQFCWGTYCRNGISTTQERSRGLLLISLLKQAFCWKPSLMFKIYWLCQVTNRTSFRPRQLASSINLTTGCLKRIKHRHDKLRVQKWIFLPGASKSPSTTLFPSLASLSLALKHTDHQNLFSFVVISPTKISQLSCDLFWCYHVFTCWMLGPISDLKLPCHKLLYSLFIFLCWTWRT